MEAIRSSFKNKGGLLAQLSLTCQQAESIKRYFTAAPVTRRNSRGMPKEPQRSKFLTLHSMSAATINAAISEAVYLGCQMQRLPHQDSSQH